MRNLPLYALIAACLAGVAAWNAQPFRERALHVRAKELAFLPSPELGRMLSCGQCGAASKLRWIDSFSYFELQLDRRDDRLAGTGESGFRRLYDLLIALDPEWETFYQHAAFNTGALVGRHDYALGFLMRGLIELPHDTALWRQAAAELCVNFGWQERQPAAMEAFLGQWAEAETSEQGKRLVWDWKNTMARRLHRGLEQLAYWQEQLALAHPRSPNAAFIERTIREQIARYDVEELDGLTELFHARHGFSPLTLKDLLEPDLLITRYAHGLPLQGPLTMRMGATVLRDDPFGFPFALANGHPLSPGLERLRAERAIAFAANQLAAGAKREGRWPSTVEEARAAGVDLPPLPPGGAYRVAGHDVVIDWDSPPSPPWPLRMILASP